MFISTKKRFILIPLILYLLLSFNSIVLANLNYIDTNSYAVYMLDINNQDVLYSKNANEKLYPASITKVMTALLTIEYANANNGFDDRVYFSNEAVFSIPRDSSNIAMNEGETLSVEEALYGLMLASANEVANALGEYVSGSEEEFVELMNKRAEELGCVNTNFANANGLHDENHYSTAKDMALIMNQAIKEPMFRKLISTVSYKIPPTEKQPLERPLNNSNKLIIPSSKFYNENIIGSKTGYTTEAQHTLVSYAKNSEKEYIVSVMYGEAQSPYTDTTNLVNTAVETGVAIDVIGDKSFKKTVPIVDENEFVKIGTATVDISPLHTETFIYSDFDPKKLSYEEEIPDELIAFVHITDEVGKINVYYDDELLKSIPLVITDISMDEEDKTAVTVSGTITPSDQPTNISYTQKNFTIKNLLILTVVLSLLMLIPHFLGKKIKH